jgi:hypothetical protein
MPTLQSDSSLSKEQIWLKRVYANIVDSLTDSTVTSSSKFDPFVSKFMGADSIMQPVP